MSSRTTKDVDEERPFNNVHAPIPKSQPNSHSQVPTPPQSHHDGNNDVGEDDYSDALSADSQQQRQQRRHPRGGRKQKQLSPSTQNLQSVSEYELPTSRRQAQPQEEEQDDFDEERDEEAPTSPLLAPPEADNLEDDYDADALKKARGSRSKAEQQRRPSGSKRSTGISSFSIERPRGGGRKPPVSVSVERPGEKLKVKSKSKGKKKAEGETEEGSEEYESEEERGRKPVQIRLDLNLEVEILLRAKIKGDITITFL